MVSFTKTFGEANLSSYSGCVLRRCLPVVCTCASLLAVTVVSWSDAQDIPPADDARDGVVVPTGVRSVQVLRAGEVIYRGPNASSGRRGIASLGARLPALEAALGAGCASRWIRVGRSAWMCQDHLALSQQPPEAQPQPVVPEGELLPYSYAFAAYAGVRTYRRLEDIENEDWAEELEQGMGVAIRESARAMGRTFVRTVSGRWIALADLRWARPSTRQGIMYEPGSTVDRVGFVMRRTATYATAEHAARPRNAHPQGFVEERTPVHIRERRQVHGREVLRTDQGWLPSRLLRIPEVPPPSDDTGTEERWVDIDTRRQILVAFEGARPVYAALVSTGRPGHPTRRGTFRVWVKLATGDMSNTDDETVDSATRVYSVERVPWVMYFHDDQALHGVYWHDRFGRPHSHGCVNLSPRDARWLFTWAPPFMPDGWEAVFPTPEEPGLRVRVR